jgi:hypothetical protein
VAKRGSIAVAKKAISSRQLELKALEEIRTFPGAEHVISVHIERSGYGWVLVVNAGSDAELDKLHYAASCTEQRLRCRYELNLGSPAFSRNSPVHP